MPNTLENASIPDCMLEQRIRQRAYELYEERLRRTDVDDWLRAEWEVASEVEREKASGITASPVIPNVTSNPSVTSNQQERAARATA